jgi:acyl dehydratase
MAAALVLDTPDRLKGYAGKEIGASEWLQITDARIREFAEASEDRQWIHTDRPRAEKESPFGAPVAHGFLTLSLISYFLGQVVEFRGGVGLMVNYGLDRVRFPAPVVSGMKIRGRFAVQEVTDSGEFVQATLHCTIEAAGSEKPACIVDWVIRLYR